MTFDPSPVPGRPHDGFGSRHPGSSHNPQAAYAMTGPIRWFDAELDRVVVHVADVNGHAGRFLDQDVTFDLTDSRRPSAELAPGIVVTIKTRLPRELDDQIPDPVPARSIAIVP